MKTARFAALLLTLLPFSWTDFGYGQITTDWNGQAGDDFANAVNWNNGVPSSADTAQFNLMGTNQVFLNKDSEIFNLRLFGGAEVLMYGQRELTTSFVEIFQEATLTLDDQTGLVSSGGVFVGNFQDGTFEIQGSSIFKSTSAVQNVIGKEPNVNGTVTVSGGGSSWQSGNLVVGEEGNGSIGGDTGSFLFTVDDVTVGRFTTANGLASLKSGAQWDVDGDFIVADGLNSTGNVAVDGNQSLLETGDASSDDFIVGKNGSASLTISNQGQVDSQTVIVGQMFSGDGDVLIESGGRWNINEDLRIGQQVDSQGKITIIGTGSELNKLGSEAVVVGEFGTGCLEVRNGGQMSTDNIDIGYEENSNGSMKIDGSAHVSANRVTVSRGGDALLEVDNGGLLDVVDLDVRKLGVVVVSNGAHVNVQDKLRVPRAVPGGLGIASMIVEDATLDVDTWELGFNGFCEGQASLINSDVNVGSFFGIGPQGALTMRNSSVTVNNFRISGGELLLDVGSAEIDSSFFTLLPEGSIRVTTPTPVNFLGDVICLGELSIAGNSQVNMHRVWTGSGSIVGTGELVLKGDIEPSNEVEFVSVQPNVTMDSTSILEYQVGGAALIDHDTFLFHNDLDIESAGLTVEFTDGFQPSVGQVFLMADVVGDLTGQFSGYPEGAVVASSNGVDLVISYSGGDGNDIVLTAVEADTLYGDVNLDGVVNLLDVSPLVERITVGPFQAEADCNMDGLVNLLDVAPFIDILTGM